jgi:hypothetical protein
MRYFILNNPVASMFYCSGSKLCVTTHKVEEAVGTEKVSKKTIEAIKGGGLREVSEDEIEAAKKKAAKAAGSKTVAPKAPDPVDDLEAKLTAMTEEQLLAYYKENFKTTKSDVEEFNKMTTEEKVSFLIED